MSASEVVSASEVWPKMGDIFDSVRVFAARTFLLTSSKERERERMRDIVKI